MKSNLLCLITFAAMFASSITFAQAQVLCFLDRRPGGCYDQQMIQQQKEQEQQLRSTVLHGEIMQLMKQAPANAVPAWCVRPADPLSPQGYVVPQDNLTNAQLQDCLDAGKAWLARKKEQEDEANRKGWANVKWKVFEADNGARFKVGPVGRGPGGNGADGVICILDNGACRPENFMRLIFDCHGHYMDPNAGYATRHATCFVKHLAGVF